MLIGMQKIATNMIMIYRRRFSSQKKFTKLFSSKKTILIIGENNFEFSLVLAKQLNTGINIVTSTPLYPGTNVKELGATVLRSVNPTAMLFDRRVAKLDENQKIICYSKIIYYKPSSAAKVEGFIERAKDMINQKGGEALLYFEGKGEYENSDYNKIGEKIGLKMKHLPLSNAHINLYVYFK